MHPEAPPNGGDVSGIFARNIARKFFPESPVTKFNASPKDAGRLTTARRSTSGEGRAGRGENARNAD